MKKIIYRIFLFALAVASSIPAFSSTAHAETLGATTSYQVPNNAKDLYGIVEGDDGSIWFSEEKYQTKRIWKFVPSTATFTSYTLSGYARGGIVYGPDNSAYAALYNGKVAKINSSVSEYSLPTQVVNGNLRYWSADRVVAGKDGNIWVAATLSGEANRALFRYTSNGTLLNKFEISTANELLSMAVDNEHDKIWVTSRDYNSSTGYTAYITAVSIIDGSSTKYATGFSAASAVTKASGGRVWFAAGNQLRNIDNSGTLSSIYTLPVASTAGAFGITEGADHNLWITLGNLDKVIRVGQDADMNASYLTGYLPGGNGAATARPLGITASSDGNIWVTQYTNGKITKIGTGVDGSGLDADGDGLSRSAEMAQGTSDHLNDTDFDGLSDFIESTSFPNRDAVFCDSTATTCAYPNPLQRDIYVETDWMMKPGEEGYSMQLTSGQAASLVDAFDNHNINLHVDYGQLGGGNEVDYNEAINWLDNSNGVDFHDYKLGGDGIAAQFNSNRQGIFRYMLLGYNYDEDSTSSGVAWAGDDDSFISYGFVKEHPGTWPTGFDYSNFNTAISGTMMHELGHNLCLTEPHPINGVWYPTQPSSCIFNGVHADSHHSNPWPNYESVMNYDNQYSMVDFSDGSHGQGDHNDWSTLRPQDFTLSSKGDSSHAN